MGFLDYENGALQIETAINYCSKYHEWPICMEKNTGLVYLDQGWKPRLWWTAKCLLSWFLLSFMVFRVVEALKSDVIVVAEVVFMLVLIVFCVLPVYINAAFFFNGHHIVSVFNLAIPLFKAYEGKNPLLLLKFISGCSFLRSFENVNFCYNSFKRRRKSNEINQTIGLVPQGATLHNHFRHTSLLGHNAPSSRRKRVNSISNTRTLGGIVDSEMRGSTTVWNTCPFHCCVHWSLCRPHLEHSRMDRSYSSKFKVRLNLGLQLELKRCLNILLQGES